MSGSDHKKFTVRVTYLDGSFFEFHQTVDEYEEIAEGFFMNPRYDLPFYHFYDDELEKEIFVTRSQIKSIESKRKTWKRSKKNSSDDTLNQES